MGRAAPAAEAGEGVSGVAVGDLGRVSGGSAKASSPLRHLGRNEDGTLDSGAGPQESPRGLFLQERLDALERAISPHARSISEDEVLRDESATKLRQGANLTREEVAAYLGVSTKKVQRMDAAGTLRRCPNMGTVVRYAARDVLRLASVK